METLLTVLHILVALFMILVVLVQGGNSGGVGAAFGGGNSAGFFGATGGQTFFGKLTYFAAAIFMLTSVSLTVIQGRKGSAGLTEELKRRAAEMTPAPTPAASTPTEQK